MEFQALSRFALRIFAAQFPGLSRRRYVLTRNFEFLKISNVSKINFKFSVVNIVKTCLWGILPGAAAAFLAACSAMPEGQSGYSASGAHVPYGGLNPMELSDLATRKYLEGSSEEALGAVDALISDAGAISIPHLREYAYTRALILNDLFDSGKCGGRSVFEAYESAFSNWEYVFAGDGRLYITRLYEYLSGFLASYDPDLAMEKSICAIAFIESLPDGEFKRLYAAGFRTISMESFAGLYFDISSGKGATEEARSLLASLLKSGRSDRIVLLMRYAASCGLHGREAARVVMEGTDILSSPMYVRNFSEYCSLADILPGGGPDSPAAAFSGRVLEFAGEVSKSDMDELSREQVFIANARLGFVLKRAGKSAE